MNELCCKKNDCFGQIPKIIGLRYKYPEKTSFVTCTWPLLAGTDHAKSRENNEWYSNIKYDGIDLQIQNEKIQPVNAQ